MALRWNLTFALLLASLLASLEAIPTSLVEEIKAADIGESKGEALFSRRRDGGEIDNLLPAQVFPLIDRWARLWTCEWEGN